MIIAEQWALIRNLYFVDKLSQRQICERIGISDKTVRKALRTKEYDRYAKGTPQRRPNEKGKVENGIKYIRQSFLAGRFFRDYYDLKAQSWQWRDDVANQRIHGTTRQRPLDRLAEEKSCLQPLSARRQRFFLAVEVRSSSQSLVRFDGNYYSVPIRYALSRLTLRTNSREVHIYDRVTL